MNHPPRFMLDIETLSTKPNAVILSIGCVYISPELVVDLNILAPKRYFYEILDRKSQSERHIDISTVEWWFGNQNSYPWTSINAPFLSDTLWYLNNWLDSIFSFLKVSKADAEFWAKGTDFDFTILRNAYESSGVPIPWAYNSIRDLRTLLKTVPKETYTPKEDNPELHNALGDAKFQARQLIEALTWREQNGRST